MIERIFVMNPNGNEKVVSDATRIEQLDAKLLPDNQRVHVSLVLNTADSQPTIDLLLLDEDLVEITRSTIIGVFNRMISFTLHNGRHNIVKMLSVQAKVIINDSELIDTRTVRVVVDSH